MRETVHFSLEEWNALTPASFADTEVSGQKNLLSGDEAFDIAFLPAMSRRRISRLSKLALRLAYNCAPGYQGYAVFGSQHGELQTTQKLLNQIIEGEPVSPAGFSGSVHNTAVGLHSIHNNNRFPCTSIAAGRDTLMMCFWEAGALLQSGAADRVLLVYADDTVPEVYQDYLHGTNEPSGFAALLTSTGNSCIQLSSEEKDDDGLTASQVEQLINICREGTVNGVYTISGEKRSWGWRIDG